MDEDQSCSAEQLVRNPCSILISQWKPNFHFFSPPASLLMSICLSWQKDINNLRTFLNFRAWISDDTRLNSWFWIRDVVFENHFFAILKLDWNILIPICVFAQKWGMERNICIILTFGYVWLSGVCRLLFQYSKRVYEGQ